MKYLYKGMAAMAAPHGDEVNASVLLGWHEKVRSAALELLTLTLDLT
jgi:hypothetical protein